MIVRQIANGNIDMLIDVITEEPVFGVFVDNAFMPLDDFIRFGTPWAGEAPNAVDEEENDIVLHGVSTDMFRPYYINIKDGEEYTLYQRVDIA